MIPKYIKYKKELMAYHNMKQRCYNPNLPGFERWGGRGIKVCHRWLNSSDNFLYDMGKCPEGLTLDRIDNNGNYNPRNCRWASWDEQIASRRPRSKTPRYLLKNPIKHKLKKLWTYYRNAIIEIKTLKIYQNQTILAKELGVSHQAVSAAFKKRNAKIKGNSYIKYKTYLTQRWCNINKLVNWRVNYCFENRYVIKKLI